MARTKETARRTTGPRKPKLNDLCRRGACDVQDVLEHVQRTTGSITLIDSELGTEGTVALMAGLALDREERYECWLDEIKIIAGGVTDEGLQAIMAYVEKYYGMKSLRLDRNDIALSGGLKPFITSLNLSSLHTISLCGHLAISSASISALFDDLTTAKLVTLRLPNCLCSGTVTSIAAYLASPRSRMLETLRLADADVLNEQIGAVEPRVLECLLDAVEERNFRLTDLVIPTFRTTPTPQAGTPSDPVAGSDRLTAFLKRNRLLIPPQNRNGQDPDNARKDERVQRAARRYLSSARILLRAQPVPISPSSTSSHFRLTDLPSEIIGQIARETSGDVRALSKAQFRRLQREAEGKGNLRQMAMTFGSPGNRYTDWRGCTWLRWAGLDRWEVEG